MNDWTCSGCGRHFNMLIPECPHCKFDNGQTITTGGTVPAMELPAMELPAMEAKLVVDAKCSKCIYRACLTCKDKVNFIPE